ncbi:hypothetical protein [Streptosporangium saharense]|uniref:Uncharacterized protein n=1 Tax=Streptosporangium saharense TaxID=1706840 RepID=A0A7W7QPK2_9ACTN|nr:hypothetical protein [Streptosporangium saharense]MBB4917421.1 hypothetical protein [Streptosporangium saharense]
MGKTNITTGGYLAVQIGRVAPTDDRPTPEETETDAAPGAVTNIRSGNARVGHQTDVITGDVTIGL